MKKRKASSQRWLQRQLRDPYKERARQENYVSRAAYKLLEINEKFKLFDTKRQQTILDLGAAPGSWLQVLTQKTHPESKLIGLDWVPLAEGLMASFALPAHQTYQEAPQARVRFIQTDICQPQAETWLHQILGGEPTLDLVLSDMAAPTTGHRQTDSLRTQHLAERSYELALRYLRPGGAVCVKFFQGGPRDTMRTFLQTHFQQVRHFKPPASRKASPEVYQIALAFKGRPDQTFT